MNLYERFKILQACFDALNMEYEILNRRLRELILETSIEQDKESRDFRKFLAYARSKYFFKHGK